MILLGFIALVLAVSSNIFASFLVQKETPNYTIFSPLSIGITIASSGVFYILLETFAHSSLTTQSVYLLFVWALVTTSHTDSQTLLISRWTSIFIAPIALLAANFGSLLITPLESIIGATLALATLALTARLAYQWKKQEALGQGDIDLLILIGAFLGPLGCFQTLLLGSITGSIVGLIVLALKGHKGKNLKLPFGAFLSLGGIITLMMHLGLIELPFL